MCNLYYCPSFTDKKIETETVNNLSKDTELVIVKQDLKASKCSLESIL